MAKLFRRQRYSYAVGVGSDSSKCGRQGRSGHVDRRKMSKCIFFSSLYWSLYVFPSHSSAPVFQGFPVSRGEILSSAHCAQPPNSCLEKQAAPRAQRGGWQPGPSERHCPRAPRFPPAHSAQTAQSVLCSAGPSLGVSVLFGKSALGPCPLSSSCFSGTLPFSCGEGSANPVSIALSVTLSPPAGLVAQGGPDPVSGHRGGDCEKPAACSVLRRPPRVRGAFPDGDLASPVSEQPVEEAFAGSGRRSSSYGSLLGELVFVSFWGPADAYNLGTEKERCDPVCSTTLITHGRDPNPRCGSEVDSIGRRVQSAWWPGSRCRVS
ncbi:uncharacterized protein LOC104867571 [Fukomys damarensis]|uniref:uncharacterized protein LOC104867571 n=1 Tax=Fukomys damarensis TaxID=885580 RepID=UPI00053FFEFE|nr:uncharacterized protein LOC104867571 [Fukomys damarensis]